MSESRDEAREILRLAKEAGCTPTLNGHWVEWRPPLPIDLLMRSLECSNAIADLLSPNHKPQ